MTDEQADKLSRSLDQLAEALETLQLELMKMAHPPIVVDMQPRMPVNYLRATQDSYAKSLDVFGNTRPILKD